MSAPYGSRPAAVFFAIAGLLAVVAGAVEVERSQWTLLAPGLWHRQWTMQSPGAQVPALGHLFRVDPRTARMTMLDAGMNPRRTASVTELRNESGALLVLNGSFFDPERRPLGLVVGQNGESSPLRRLDQGIFLIAGGVPQIQHASEPVPADVEMAVQAFPRLVVDGQPLRMKPQRSRRTVICVPGDGSVLLLVVDNPVSLQDLAVEAAKTPAEGGLGCWSALNLDGGPSTQASLRTPEMSLEIEGGWPVPNGIAVLPR